MAEQRVRRMPKPAPDAAEALDRVFMHDLVLDVEIGVYTNEKGVTQRVRFSVDVDVSPATGALDDDIGARLRLRHHHQSHQGHRRPRPYQSGRDFGRGGGARIAWPIRAPRGSG